MLKNSHRQSGGVRFLAWGLALAGLVALFVFFQFFYRNHLCHREQFSLFLWAAEPLRAYGSAPAPVSRLLGDVLTQFLGLNVVGPLIMALTLTILGVLTYKLFSKFLKLWALIPAVLIVVVETGRQCGLTYPLSSTLQWVGIVGTLLIVLGLNKSPRAKAATRRAASLVAGFLILAAGIWLFGWGDWGKRAVMWPEMNVERMLAIDNDWYHGRLDHMQHQLDKQAKHPSRFNSYYLTCCSRLSIAWATS